MGNIILIMADQFRYDCLGRLGNYPVKTPNLDKLAAEGIFFEHAFTPMPVCAPARQCLASGRMADSFGGFWNYDMKGLPCKSFVSDGDTWSNRLESAGFNMGFLGKWHSSEIGSPKDFGYQNFIGNEVWARHIAEKYPNLSHTKGFNGEISYLPYEDNHSHFMAAKAVDMLDGFLEDNKPFFLRLDFNDPHLPCRPSEPFAGMYSKGDAVPWPSFGDTFEGKPYIQRQMVLNWENEGQNWDYFSEIVARYYAVISQLDDAIGNIIKKVDSSGAREDTMIIFTSDHGDTSGGHGMMDKHYVLYDDNCRIPFIIRYPKLVKPGTVCKDFVSNMLDIPPTIEELCGIAKDEERHGLSLLPLLKGEAQPQRDAFAISSSNGQQFGFYSNRAIRTAKWRYVWNLTDVDELYDCENDEGELINLINEPAYEEVVKDLRLKLHGKLVSFGDPFADGWASKQLTEGRKI